MKYVRYTQSSVTLRYASWVRKNQTRHKYVDVFRNKYSMINISKLIPRTSNIQRDYKLWTVHYRILSFLKIIELLRMCLRQKKSYLGLTRYCAVSSTMYYISVRRFRRTINTILASRERVKPHRLTSEYSDRAKRDNDWFWWINVLWKYFLFHLDNHLRCI